MTTFRLTAREEQAVEAVKLWLDSLRDAIALSCDETWGESEAAASIPTWVRNATKRLDRTIFAPVTETLDALEFTPYRAGFALGMLKWSVKRMEAKPSPEVRRVLERHRLSARAKRKVGKLFEDFLIRGGFITRAEFRRSKFIPSRFEKYVATVENKPLVELAEFHRGMAEGLRGVGKESPNDRSDLSTEIHLALVMWWRFVVRLKSVTELHAWLVRMMGAPKVGDKKRVEKICERIGLTLREPGRPKETPTLLLMG